MQSRGIEKSERDVRVISKAGQSPGFVVFWVLIVHLCLLLFAQDQQTDARRCALSSDDLLSLKELAEACTALEEAGVEDANCLAAAERVAGMEIRNLQEALEAKTHGRRIVSDAERRNETKIPGYSLPMPTMGSVPD